MMKRMSFVCVIMAVLFAAGGAFAGPTWESGWVANNDGAEFWDHLSWDGEDQNVGFKMDSSYPYKSNGSGTPYNYIGFNNEWGPSQYYATAVATLVSETSSYAAINEFGYYALDNRSTLYPIFTGADSAVKTVTFPQLAVNYGFYLKNNDGTWFSWRIPEDPEDKLYNQHFAMFKESDDVFWFGTEDLVFYDATTGAPTSDFDYNDMIVRVDFTGTPVPEPATLLLLGIGLAGLAGAGRRFKN